MKITSFTLTVQSESFAPHKITNTDEDLVCVEWAIDINIAKIASQRAADWRSVECKDLLQPENFKTVQSIIDYYTEQSVKFSVTVSSTIMIDPQGNN